MTSAFEASEALRAQLRALGISPRAIGAAWPKWWTPEADSSESAKLELRFEIARRLGLDPRTLVEPNAALSFLWLGGQFKHLTTETPQERAAISSFGMAVARILVDASSAGSPAVLDRGPAELRQAILRSGAPHVSLGELLLLAWSSGTPVVHLRVYPLAQKRMAAMVASSGERAAVLLAKDGSYPAQLAFYVAHELGHIALGHVGFQQPLVELDQENPSLKTDDKDEADADAYAIELLTGDPKLRVLPATGFGSGRELARTAMVAGREQQIDPGVIAQIYGYSTGEWPSVNVALGEIYGAPRELWADINDVAKAQITPLRLNSDARPFLTELLGDSRADV